MTNTRYCELRDRGIARLSGADTRAFLQGLVTNDVERLDRDPMIYTALLTPQGKYLFDFFLIADGEDVLIDCAAARLPALLKRLSFYKLRAAVSLSDLSADYAVVAAWAEPEGTCDLPAGGPFHADPRLPALGLRAVLPRGEIAAACGKLRASGAEMADYDRHRISLGVPASPDDLVPEASFPLETNLDLLQAIDFGKGCFVGQEVTSRTKRRGSVRKRMRPIAGHGPLPAPGTDIVAGERVVGTVGSGRDHIGLALLRLDLPRDQPLLAEGRPLHLIPPPSWLAGEIAATQTSQASE